jgi:hypothetical protein
VAAGAAVSGAEQGLESAMLAVLAADVGVQGVLGEPLRVLEVSSPAPAYPYLEIARHLTSPAGAAGYEASEHRVDLVAVSRLDGGEASRLAMSAVRAALGGAQLEIEGWRCVLLVPVFADTLHQGRGIWRSVLRMKAVVEAA